MSNTSLTHRFLRYFAILMIKGLPSCSQLPLPTDARIDRAFVKYKYVSNYQSIKLHFQLVWYWYVYVHHLPVYCMFIRDCLVLGASAQSNCERISLVLKSLFEIDNTICTSWRVEWWEDNTKPNKSTTHWRDEAHFRAATTPDISTYRGGLPNAHCVSDVAR